MKKMTCDVFAEAVDGIDRGLLDEHFARDAQTVKPARRFPWKQVLLTAACLVLLASVAATAVLIAQKSGEPVETREVFPANRREPTPTVEKVDLQNPPQVLTDLALVQAELPVGPREPLDNAAQEEWSAYRDWRKSMYEESQHIGMPTDFFAACAGAFLCGTEANENRIIAPFNIYMALAMMAETASGDTQTELLRALGEPDTASLRAKAAGLVRISTCDNGLTTSLPGASLWLNRNFTYKKDTLNRLRDDYYASVYAGEMGSESYDRAIGEWLNYQTGGLLSDYADSVQTDEDTLAVLYSTLLFQAMWYEGDEKTEAPGVFHGAVCDRECTMLTDTETGSLVEGNTFISIDVPLNDSYAMRLLLPKEGVTVDEVLQDPEAAAYAMGGSAEKLKCTSDVILHEAFPSFDVTCKTDLISGLKALGVEKCFTSAADFTQLTEDTQLFISKAESNVRLIADKDGVSGAAVVEIRYTGSAMPQNEFWFTCDRPFICSVINPYGVPLFAGVINDP